jgi:YD repeat-containing protein
VQASSSCSRRTAASFRAYDSRDNVVRETDAAVGRTRHSRGNRRRTTNPVSASWSYAYDAAGQVTRTVNPSGDAIENARIVSGNILAETRTQVMNGVATTMLTRFTYDALNRATRSVNAGGAVHEGTYTPTGQLATRLDPCCGHTVFLYDEQDRVVETTHPDGTRESVTYDAEGREMNRTDRAGRVTQFTHDAAGRLASTNVTSGLAVRRGG